MEEDKLQELIDYAATLYDSPISTEDVKNALMRQGADEELVKEIIQIVDKSQRKERVSKGKYALLGGCGLLFLGALLTVISFVVAIVRDGDRFAIFWKTMLIGLLLIIGGIVDFVISKSKRD